MPGNGTLTAHGPCAESSLLTEIPRAHPRRLEVERTIRRRFRSTHGARVSRFLPHLLILEGHHGRVTGTAGYRIAADEELFVEVYVDAPIEVLLERRLGLRPPRASIVEVGNLTSVSSDGARELIRAIAFHLHRCDFQWAVFTATSMLLNTLRKLDLLPYGLAAADPARLGREAREWGRYYHLSPQVVAGSLKLACQRLSGRPIYSPCP